MQVHSNATTNKKQRERMIGSPKTCRTLAQEMAISLATVHRWKHRDSPEERSCRPHKIEYAFDAMYQTLRSVGIEPDGPPKQEEWSEVDFFVTDPDGNLVEFGVAHN